MRIYNIRNREYPGKEWYIMKKRQWKQKGKMCIAWMLMCIMLVFTGCGSSDLGSNDAPKADAMESLPAEEGIPSNEGKNNADSMPESGAADGLESAESEATEGLESAESEAMDELQSGMKESKAAAEDSYYDSIYDYGNDDYIVENSEEYNKMKENGFLSVKDNPLSTFSADVDTASYSNLRRMILSGYSMEDIPEGAVRIEELLNYFTYQYKEPKNNEPFAVTTEIASCPWNSGSELLMIGLNTKAIDYNQMPPSNLVFLLDVSGSMYSEDKLPLLQESFSLLAENLTKKDRVSIVTYAGSDTIVLKGVEGNKTTKIVKALQGLEAGGGTHGSKGIITAYELAEKYFIEGGNNRVILATDGDLNVGLTSESELEKLITEKRESGVYLSVLGFGTGNIKDNKMELLADKGNGNYAYIDTIKEADKVLVKEMGATLLTVCKDVKFQVEFNPAVVAGYRLIGYENRALANKDFADDTKDAGEVGAGHSVTVLYEITLKEPLPYSRKAEKDGITLKYQDEKSDDADSTAISEEWLTLSVRYKKPSEDTSKLLEYPVDYESYQTKLSDDFLFASAVAEWGMLVGKSDYAEDASVDAVIDRLKSMRLSDEYREEFYELVQVLGE